MDLDPDRKASWVDRRGSRTGETMLLQPSLGPFLKPQGSNLIVLLIESGRKKSPTGSGRVKPSHQLSI
jgi:hypothetical protein